MAIETKQIEEILGKEGEISTKAESLLNLFNEDVKAQLNAVLVNKETILQEKRDSESKRKVLEEELNAAKNENEKLQKQLKDSSPDEMGKIYEQKLSEMSNIHEKKVNDLNKVLDGYKNKVAELERSQLKLECMKEFNAELEGKNVAPDAINDLADYILGVNCEKFDYRPIGEGKSILATKDGTTIKQALVAGLATSFGKRCVISKNSGGNAEGTTWSGVNGPNPFKTGNLTEQMRLYSENKELYDALKREAQ